MTGTTVGSGAGQALNPARRYGRSLSWYGARVCADAVAEHTQPWLMAQMLPRHAAHAAGERRWYGEVAGAAATGQETVTGGAATRARKARCSRQ